MFSFWLISLNVERCLGRSQSYRWRCRWCRYSLVSTKFTENNIRLKINGWLFQGAYFTTHLKRSLLKGILPGPSWPVDTRIRRPFSLGIESECTPGWELREDPCESSAILIGHVWICTHINIQPHDGMATQLGMCTTILTHTRTQRHTYTQQPTHTQLKIEAIVATLQHLEGSNYCLYL